MAKRLVIVGGDAAGMSAAAQARRAAPQLEVVVLEKSAYASYGACGMPYYIAGDIESHEKLLALTPPQMQTCFTPYSIAASAVLLTSTSTAAS